MMVKKTPELLLRVCAVSTLISIIFLLFFNREYLAVGSDFISYYFGAQIVSDGNGKSLYDLGTQFQYQENATGPGVADWVLPFRGLPFVTLVYLPFTFFPITTAYFLFVLFNIILLITIYKLAKDTFPIIQQKVSYVFFLIFLFLPIMQNIWMGQLSLFLLLAYLFIYKTIKSNNSFLTGLIASLLLIKFQYIVSWPFLFLLVKNKKHFLSGLVLSGAALLLINYIISGNSTFSYLNFLISTENSNFGSRPNEMLTFFSVLSHLLGEASLKVLLVIHFAVYTTIFVLLAYRIRNTGFSNAFISVIFLTLVFSVHMLGYDLSILVIPFLIFIENSYSKDYETNFIKNVLLAVLIFLLPLLTLSGVTYYISLVLIIFGIYILFWDVPINELRTRNKN